MISNTTIGITFTKQEQEIYRIKAGDYVDLSDMVIISEQLNNVKNKK